MFVRQYFHWNVFADKGLTEVEIRLVRQSDEKIFYRKILPTETRDISYDDLLELLQELCLVVHHGGDRLAFLGLLREVFGNVFIYNG
jgi:hypothetical protein